MTARPIWIAYVVLLGMSIPWYFPAGSAEPIIAGFPFWCLISLGCYVTAALLTVLGMDTLWQAETAGDDPQPDPKQGNSSAGVQKPLSDR